MFDTPEADFSVGQLVQHRKFGYRGVIIDVDSRFLGSGGGDRNIAPSKPPRDRPWYHVLIDGAAQRSYVAERNLEPDTEGGPVNHPDISDYFLGLGEEGYILRDKGH